MPAKLKYGEPTQMISIRVPQSRKEEIRELVRGALNGDDIPQWLSYDVKPKDSGQFLCRVEESTVIAFYYHSDDCWMAGYVTEIYPSHWLNVEIPDVL